MTLHSILAAVYRESFAQGEGELASAELLFVVFLLGLLTGVLAMGAFFVWHTRREQKRRRFPSETMRLLDEFEDEGGPERDRRKPAPKPWERDPNWWKE